MPPKKEKSKFHSNLAQAFINQENTDCSFELVSILHCDSWKVLGAHKVVLAAASPVFRKMFNGSFKDSMPIRIEDIYFEAFQCFLWIIYKQKVVALPEKLKATPFYSVDVYKAAHKYLCTQTLAEIRTFVQAHIKQAPHEACNWLELSEFYDDKHLRMCSEQFISKNATVVLQSQEFLQMQPENVAMLFSFKELVLNDEYELVVALENYLKTNCSIDLSNQHIRAAKKFIRFLLLSDTQIYETNILTAEEKEGILNCYNSDDCKITMKNLQLSTKKSHRLKPNTSVDTSRKPGVQNFNFVSISGFSIAMSNESVVLFM